MKSEFSFENKIKVNNMVIYAHMCSRWYMCSFIKFKQFHNFRAFSLRNYVLSELSLYFMYFRSRIPTKIYKYNSGIKWI